MSIKLSINRIGWDVIDKNLQAMTEKWNLTEKQIIDPKNNQKVKTMNKVKVVDGKSNDGEVTREVRTISKVKVVDGKLTTEK